ncbi:unnamed protein product, partial [Ectocarpus sp. 12 AP-2014]
GHRCKGYFATGAPVPPRKTRLYLWELSAQLCELQQLARPAVETLKNCCAQVASHGETWVRSPQNKYSSVGGESTHGREVITVGMCSIHSGWYPRLQFEVSASLWLFSIKFSSHTPSPQHLYAT